MKLLLTSLALFLSIFSYAGEFTSAVLTKGDDGTFRFEKIINIEGQNKEALYKRLKEWVLANVKTADNNIIFDDTNFERIVTTPTLSIENVKRYVINQKANFKLNLSFKDNKIKVTATSFSYFGTDCNRKVYSIPLETVYIKAIIPNPNKKIGENFDFAFSSMIQSLEKAANTVENSNW